MTGSNPQSTAPKKGTRGEALGRATSAYALVRLVLNGGLVLRFALRSSVGDRATMLFGRYSAHYALFLVLFGSFAAWNGLLISRRRCRAAPRQPFVTAVGLWVLTNLGLAHFGDSLGSFWQFLVLCQVALLTAEGAFMVFVLSRRWRRHRAAAAVTHACLALSGLFLLSVAVEVGVRCGGPRVRSLGGLCDTMQYRFNALGLRGNEIRTPKADDERRVIVLGDSITFGQAVAEEDTFAAVLERLFAADGLTCTVINAGERGTNTRDQAAKMEALLALKPDLIVQTYVLNDAEDEPYRPVTLLPVVERHLLGWSTCLSALRTALTRALATMGLREGQAERLDRLYGGPSWQAARDAMGRTVAMAHAQGVPILLGIMPVLTEFDSYPFSDIHHRVVTAAEEAGYDVVTDLLPLFLGTALPAQQLHALPFDSHPGPAAHRLVGEAYYPLCRQYVGGRDGMETEDTDSP